MTPFLFHSAHVNTRMHSCLVGSLAGSRARPASLSIDRSMNDLQRYFESNTGRLIDKHTHYFDIYDRFFTRYRNTEVCFVEIGIYNGGSLQMWKHYFGPKAKFSGLISTLIVNN